jgi:hypothetical protein
MLTAMDNQKVTILVLLDLSSAFDTIDYDIMSQRLPEIFNIKGTVLNWTSSYLQGRTNRVLISGQASDEHIMHFGIPQGSVMGPGLFTRYTYPVGQIIQQSGLQYHIYADDTQIYTCFNPRVPGDTVVALFKLQRCIGKIKQWMDENKLKLNEEKTEFFIAGSKNTLTFLDTVSLNVCGSDVTPTETVKNLGVHLDSSLTMSDHITSICRALNYQLRNIWRIRKYITKDTCNHAIRSLILSRLDYSNSLLYGISSKDTQKLQKIQNRAARLIFQVGRREHTSPLIKELHWLPVKERITYKTLLLVYKSLNELAPAYLADILNIYTPPSGCRHLRSHTDSTRLTCYRTHNTSGDKAFINSAPKLWNNLPITLRQSNSISEFKSKLKTHLFPSV